MGRTGDRRDRRTRDGPLSARDPLGRLTGAPVQSEGDRRRCAHCGAPLTTTEWHAIRTDRDDDGQLLLRHFCDEDCVDAWAADG